MLDLTPLEAELLHAALRGDWIELLIGLWPSWGFCPRHAIGFATLELERQDSLFSTAIYYRHFIEAAASSAAVRRRRWRRIRSRLTGTANCLICERVDAGKAAGMVGLAKQVNERRQVRRRIGELRTSWPGRACPLCVEGAGGIVCRPHVLAGAEPESLAVELAALHERLRRLVGSMCATKTPTNSLDRFAWLEAIGWLGGWEYPQRLLNEGERSNDER